MRHVDLYLGDCVEVMRELPAESVDAIVTDPPYNLGFMGKAWDSKHQHEPWAREAFRVAKPGSHLLAFGGTRTYHRLASAIEDAGWEIRDCLVWAYASGFPKSLDVSKAIDKAAGAERQKVAVGKPVKRMIPGADQDATGSWIKDNGREYQPGPEIAATPDTAKWDGWGTALKPAWEPIVMARKPLRGTVAANVTTFGTGALNIDATRIGFMSAADEQESKQKNRHADFGTEPGGNEVYGDYSMVEWTNYTAPGRWPANLILTDPIFDGDTPGVVGGGQQNSGAKHTRRGKGIGYGSTAEGDETEVRGGAGTYSRFFLIPKASRRDREPAVKTRSDGERENTHPTVKPVVLMRHLVRLVTPPGGLVLDPFIGSGTTAIAANLEGFRCIGIDREEEYLDIAEARLAK